MAEPEALEITCTDGTPIGARRFEPSGPLRGVIVMAGATGVPQGFYRRFASFAAAQGYRVFTFDFRGVGASRRVPLKGYAASYVDWAQRDLAAVVDHAAAGGLPVWQIGHSFGGHAFAMLPNWRKLSGLVTFGTGSGWSGWMPMGERVKLEIMWRLVLPPLVPILGYMPSRRLGLGEDLPVGVYRQWSRWCRMRNHLLDDPEAGDLAANMAAITLPVTMAVAADDLWARPASRDAFGQGFRSARMTLLEIDPAPYGGLGHMGYFRPEAAPLWAETLSRLSA